MKMAPIPRGDLDVDNPSSDVGDSQYSPLRRQFSEPYRPQSTSTQISQSPEPMPRRVKCDWCGKLLMLPNDNSISEEALLKTHSNEAHPKHIRFPGYDGTEDGAEDGTEDGAEYGADDTYDENGDLQDDDAIEQDEPEARTAKPENGEAQLEGNAVIAVEPTTDDSNGTQPTTIPVNVTNMPPPKLDRIDWLSNPRTSYTEDYRLRTAEWQRPDVKQRLARFWNVHDAKKFSPDYDHEAAKCESTWDHVFHDLSKPRKRDTSEPPSHPLPYKKARVERGQFLEIQVPEIENLVNMLRNPEKYNPEELYALTQTGAFILKTIQEEYLALDELYLKAHRHKRDLPSYETKRHQVQGHKKKGAGPMAKVNEDKLDFEERKEAMLYGYKHNYFPGNLPTLPIRSMQDPFVQGGFVPTPAQARKMITKKTESGEPNPDGWTPMKKHGLDYHPQLYEPRREPIAPKVTRKRKAAEVAAPTKATDTEETQNESADGDETEEDNHPAKRRSRGRGGKTIVADYIPADANSRRGSGRGRGRGRGRGVGRLGSSRATFEVTPAPAQPSSRGRGRRGASNLASSSIPSAGESSFPAVEPVAAVTPVEPAPAVAKKEALSAEAIEEARRQKIANSKNPKRTKAMLDHWDRFNREGRIRNPKRSKAQIEQDRTVSGDGAADEAPKPTGLGRRKRSPSLVPLAGNLAPKGPPGLPPMASVQAQQPMPPTLPPMGVVAHYGPGPVNPYAAAAPVAPMAQLGQPMPPQYAPFPYVQYGMPPLPGHNPGGRH